MTKLPYCYCKHCGKYIGTHGRLKHLLEEHGIETCRVREHFVNNFGYKYVPAVCYDDEKGEWVPCTDRRGKPKMVKQSLGGEPR